jgi:hypothetical protein
MSWMEREIPGKATKVAFYFAHAWLAFWRFISKVMIPTIHDWLDGIIERHD